MKKKHDLTWSQSGKARKQFWKHRCGNFETSRRITINLHGPLIKTGIVKYLNTFTRLIELEIFNWLMIPHKIKAKSKLTQNAKLKLVLESIL
jgi:hypothetical protein